MGYLPKNTSQVKKRLRRKERNLEFNSMDKEFAVK
jgi:hypothetical protein